MFFLFFFVVAVILFTVLFATAFICYLIRHSNHNEKTTQRREKVSLCAVLGSGGHTAEMLNLLQHLGDEYSTRTYIIADTDIMSCNKVKTFEEKRSSGTWKLHLIPRSREVGQSYLSSIFSTLYASIYSFKYMFEVRPDLLLLNGPGTCIPIAIAAAFFDLIRLNDTIIIYEESICRVNKLSLSGAILYYSGLVDDLLVQWPELKQRYPRCTYIGHLTEFENK